MKALLIVLSIIIISISAYCNLLSPTIKKQNIDLSTKVKNAYVKSFRDGFMVGWVEKEKGSDLSESYFRTSEDDKKWIEVMNATNEPNPPNIAKGLT